MLFTVLDIVFTIAAWTKGWRWRALVPWAIVYGCAFLMGAAVGATGGSVDKAAPLFALMELGLLAVLIGLSLRRPQQAQGSVVEEISVVPKPVRDTAQLEAGHGV